MSQSPELSVVVPVCNEAENVEPLAREIDAALNDRDYEMIFIDDGSTDDTAIILLRLKAQLPRCACCGIPSAAACAPRASGVGRRALGGHVDGDGQNGLIPALARVMMSKTAAAAFQGNRKEPHDTAASWPNIANGVLLAERRHADTGCGCAMAR
jgi:dolichol-phosphate mannosyltransferase